MRCFIALPLPEAAQDSLVRATAPLRRHWPDLAWAPPEQYHLTLAFLGELEAAGVAAAEAALATLAVAPTAAIKVYFPRLLTFPPRGPWRVLAASVEAKGDAGSLHRLYADINAALAREARRAGLWALNEEWPDADREGSRPRRPFKAHVTLARSLRRQGSRGCAVPDRLDPLILENAAQKLRHGLSETRDDTGGFLLEAVLLYKSELRPQGAVHSELARLHLAGH